MLLNGLWVLALAVFLWGVRTIDNKLQAKYRPPHELSVGEKALEIQLNEQRAEQKPGVSQSVGNLGL
ncbi:hypothetical protein [Salsuginibacillus kocurii]|uniref:hypothetical protein n=1 Tax=Salsuginibacillus kocurii TaxID=427078 RepID=UPI00036DCD52|nr:hypothetical protein [Salsuginibacillus kocurii]